MQLLGHNQPYIVYIIVCIHNLDDMPVLVWSCMQFNLLTKDYIVLYLDFPGLIEWETVEDAIDALARTNHTAIELDTYNHPFHLKLAFSNKPITEGYRPPMTMMMPKPAGDQASSGPPKVDNEEDAPQEEK